MISNVMLEIGGRQALSVRALSYVCGWAESPDSLVRALRLEPLIRVGGVIQRLAGRRVEIKNQRSLQAYKYIADGTWQPIPPSQWQTTEVALCSLTKKLRADEREDADGENHARWRVEATLMLPGDAFVWFDEFERWFAVTRPLAIPTDDDLDLWRIEQTRLHDGDDLQMVLEEGMTDFDRVGQLDLTVILPNELNGKVWGYGLVSPFASDVTASQVPSKKGIGRPRTISKKVSALAHIMDLLGSIGVWDNRLELPGCRADLRDACERIEKQTTGKLVIFAISEARFGSVLAEAGFAFQRGRRREHERGIWTRNAPRIVAKIDPRVFAQINDSA